MTFPSDDPAVICPMQQGLALAWATVEVAPLACALDLAHMPTHRLPTADLPRIIRHAPPAPIAAIPLEPAAGVVRMYPALGAPDREGLARINPEKVERRIATAGRELRALEPARRELVPTIRHVFAAEHPSRSISAGESCGRNSDEKFRPSGSTSL